MNEELIGHVISVLSLSGRTKLAGITTRRTLFAFDYDGTLAPITSDPHQAFMSEQTSKLLRELAHQAPVAVISGRRRRDLKNKLGFEPSFLIGNHGIEDQSHFSSQLRKVQKSCQCWTIQLRSRLPRGVFLENKKFSLSLHYRHCQNPSHARQQLIDLIATLHPQPHVISGKYVINLLDPKSPHKGHALKKILQRHHFESVFYAGDDETDEKVFAMPDKNIFSVVIGKKRGSKASFYLDRQSHIDRILHILLENTRRSSPPSPKKSRIK